MSGELDISRGNDHDCHLTQRRRPADIFDLARRAVDWARDERARHRVSVDGRRHEADPVPRLIAQPMTVASAMPLAPTDQELVITRLLSAPRELVFAAFTDPKQLRRWWGPKDYPATHIEMDVRVGGRWRNCLTAAAD